MNNAILAQRIQRVATPTLPDPFWAVNSPNVVMVIRIPLQENFATMA